MNLRHALVIILTLAFALSGCGNGFSATVPPTLTRTKSSIAATQASVTSQPIATSTAAVTNPPKSTAALAPVATLALCTDNNADFVADVTIPDGTSIKPGAQFTKIWRLRNTGRCTWDAGYRLAYFDGPQMTTQDFVDLTQEIKPNQTADISVVFTAPRETGAVKTRWQMQSPDGTRFGKRVFIVIYAGTSLIDPIAGLWRGAYTSGAEGDAVVDAHSGESDFEFRAACANGLPCVRIPEIVGKDEVPFSQESSHGQEYCFTTGETASGIHCFTPQPDGTLAYKGGGFLWGARGTLHKVSE